MHYAWVSRLRTKDIDLTRHGQFSYAWLTNLDKLLFNT